MPKRVPGVPPQLRRFKYQYRLVWAYKGQPRPRRLMAESAQRILRALRRIATTEPWRGTTQTTLKKAWVRLAFLMDAPFEVVEGMGPREVIQRIQDAYGPLDFVRVEYRQVGQWTEMLDPLANLPTAGTANGDAKMARFYDKVEQMTPEQLNAWRVYPAAWRANDRVRGLPGGVAGTGTGAPAARD